MTPKELQGEAWNKQIRPAHVSAFIADDENLKQIFESKFGSGTADNEGSIISCWTSLA